MKRFRRSIGAQVRFEVFKRDLFTCQYCGAKPPATSLHLDHVHPFSEGGSDDDNNLITACRDCNLGKGSRPLDVDQYGDFDLYGHTLPWTLKWRMLNKARLLPGYMGDWQSYDYIDFAFAAGIEESWIDETLTASHDWISWARAMRAAYLKHLPQYIHNLVSELALQVPE